MEDEDLDDEHQYFTALSAARSEPNLLEIGFDPAEYSKAKADDVAAGEC